MQNNNKIKCLVMLLSAASLGYSCKESDNVTPQRQSVNVSFSTSVPQDNSAPVYSPGEDGLSALIFRQDNSDSETLSYLEDLETRWSKKSDTEFTMGCTVEVGTYYFVFAKGLSLSDSENAEGKCYLDIKGTESTLGDYVIRHPEVSGQPADCEEALYLNENRTVPCYLTEATDVKNFSATLKHVQGRFDLIFVKCEDGEGHVPAEGNPLEGISGVQLDMKGMNTSYTLDGVSGSPDDFSLKTASADFSDFRYGDYRAEFVNAPEKFMITDDNVTGKIKKYHFFPVEGASVNLTVEFENGHKVNRSVDLNLTENKANILLVWVTSDYLVLKIEDFSGEELGNTGKGDEGFWY